MTCPVVVVVLSGSAFSGRCAPQRNHWWYALICFWSILALGLRVLHIKFGRFARTQFFEVMFPVRYRPHHARNSGNTAPLILWHGTCVRLLNLVGSLYYMVRVCYSLCNFLFILCDLFWFCGAILMFRVRLWDIW